jgi:transcription antitermination factor NusG
VLLGDNGPQFISEAIIMSIKGREYKGLVELDPAPKFNKGDKVKTDEGPLSGLPLLYEGMSGPDRVKVLVELLGRKVLVTIPEKSLVAA